MKFVLRCRKLSGDAQELLFLKQYVSASDVKLSLANLEKQAMRTIRLFYEEDLENEIVENEEIDCANDVFYYIKETYQDLRKDLLNPVYSIRERAHDKLLYSSQGDTAPQNEQSMRETGSRTNNYVEMIENLLENCQSYCKVIRYTAVRDIERYIIKENDKITECLIHMASIDPCPSVRYWSAHVLDALRKRMDTGQAGTISRNVLVPPVRMR